MWRVVAVVVLAMAALASAEPATRPALKIVCFGDSITGEQPGKAYQAQYLKYADLLQLMLEARLGEGGVQVINSGWAGDTTYPKPNQQIPGAVARLQKDVIDHHPDIAVVLIGGNDKQDTDEARKLTGENLKQIALRLKEAKIRTLMLQYHPAMAIPSIKAKEAGKAWDHLAAKNPQIAEAAAAAGAALLDMGPPMKQAAQAHGAAQLVDDVDGVHLRPRGEMIYARAIHARLLELGWVGTANR